LEQVVRVPLSTEEKPGKHRGKSFRKCETSLGVEAEARWKRGRRRAPFAFQAQTGSSNRRHTLNTRKEKELSGQGRSPAGTIRSGFAWFAWFAVPSAFSRFMRPAVRRHAHFERERVTWGRRRDFFDHGLRGLRGYFYPCASVKSVVGNFVHGSVDVYEHSPFRLSGTQDSASRLSAVIPRIRAHSFQCEQGQFGRERTQRNP